MVEGVVLVHEAFWRRQLRAATKRPGRLTNGGGLNECELSLRNQVKVCCLSILVPVACLGQDYKLGHGARTTVLYKYEYSTTSVVACFLPPIFLSSCCNQ